MDLRQQVGSADPANATAQREIAISHERIANVLASERDHKAAVEHYLKSVAIHQALVDADSVNVTAQRDLALAHNLLANAFANSGESAAAMENYSKSLAIRQKLADADPNNAVVQRDLWGSFHNLAITCDEVGRNLAVADDVRISSLTAACSWYSRADKQAAILKKAKLISLSDSVMVGNDWVARGRCIDTLVELSHRAATQPDGNAAK